MPAEITEADEAAGGSLEHALFNLRAQHRQGETMGILAMYERAAVDLGATLEELHEAATEEALKDWTGRRDG